MGATGLGPSFGLRRRSVVGVRLAARVRRSAPRGWSIGVQLGHNVDLAMIDPVNPLAPAYLDLLKQCLTRLAFPDARWETDLLHVRPFDRDLRLEGRDWPTEAETMVGLKRLDNLQMCVETVLRDQVAGDLVETGVWRGGASILMRGVLKAHAETTRTVWVADSFQGLPKPVASEYPADAGDPHWTFSTYLAVPLEIVQANFARYGLLDRQVQFLKGWFRDTLPTAPIERIAVLRMDGDMYESTILALSSLYPRLSSGGFVIIDDYGALANCRRAVEDFRAAQGIEAPVFRVDWTGAYWRKP
jgi:O-methyltransferase